MTASVAVDPNARACAIAVMVKASTPGLAKTRLMPAVTPLQAAQLNTAFLQDSVGNVIAAGRSARIAAYAAYGPAGSAPFFREHLPAEVGLIECCLPNFGACLLHALTTLFERGHDSACVLNADSPTLPTAYLVDAARALSSAEDRIVLGPSDDGGYYLLGVKRAHRRLFEDIAWSTADVCRQTQERAAGLGLPIHWLETWYDVDDAASLARLNGEIDDTSGAVREPPCYGAPQTRAALRRVNRSLPAAAAS